MSASVLSSYTSGQIAERVREAHDTLKRLPREVIAPAGLASHWPDIVRDTRDAYGYTKSRMRLGAPDSKAIDRMHEVFDWLMRFFQEQPAEARILWMCCGIGMGPRRVAAVIGCHRHTVMKKRDGALARIVSGLRA